MSMITTHRTIQVCLQKKAGAAVRYEKKQGKGNVIRSMFRQINADCYIMVDGDDTYPAENAKEMARLILEEEYDMVIGDRLSATYFTENKRPFHNSGNKIVRMFINHLFGSSIENIMTGYRAFSKLFVKNFPVISKGFEIETEMTIHALDKNYNIVSLPVEYRDRPEGSVSKLNTVGDGMKVLLTIFNLYREYQPMRFFTFLSIILAIISSLLFIPIAIEYLKTGLVPRFPTLIVSGAIMIISLLLFMCGVILDTVIRKHRQLYEILLNKYDEKES